MKKLLFTALALLALAPFLGKAQFINRVFAEPILPSAPDGYVLDEANILSAETEAQLQTELAELEAENSTQMVVVTVSDLQGYEPEQYALALGREWGVGQEEFNNGLVFLVAPNERAVRIEVGYGLEGAITDAQSYMILDQIALPLFATGDYDQGVLQSMEVLEKLARGEAYDLSELAPSTSMQDFLPFIFIILPFIWAIISWFSSTKSWWLGGIFGGVFGAIVFQSLLGIVLAVAMGLFLDYMVSTFLYGKLLGRGSHSGFWGGGGFGGGSGGGFGGFGGGSFGGGGASGRW